MTRYFKIFVPSTWFFGYQYEGGVLVVAVIPFVAVSVEVRALRHYLSCDMCRGS